jgi:hypothetical protein
MQQSQMPVPSLLVWGRALSPVRPGKALQRGAAMIPPLPKNYDVENRGYFSAGRLRPTKKPKKTKAKPSTTATFGNDVEGEGPQ